MKHNKTKDKQKYIENYDSNNILTTISKLNNHTFYTSLSPQTQLVIATLKC